MTGDYRARPRPGAALGICRDSATGWARPALTSWGRAAADRGLSGAAQARRRRWASTATSAPGWPGHALTTWERAAGDGDYPGAAEALEEALGIYRDLGDRGGEAEVLNEVGTLHRVRGDLDPAGACHQRALDLAREIGSSWDEAHALAGLARCALAAGRTAKAEDRLRQALEIFQRIGAAEAADVSAELEALTDARPTAQGS